MGESLVFSKLDKTMLWIGTNIFTEKVTSSQSFGQLTFVLSQDKKTWEFFSRIAQFFNLQIGFTWKFHLSRHSRFRRPSLFPHSLPADFSPSLTNLVNTIYKGHIT